MKRVIRIHSNVGQHESGDTLYDIETERHLVIKQISHLLADYRHFTYLKITITIEDMKEEDFDRLPDFEPIGTENCRS
jgi:hypothetical protein